jgi:hypothetical protein
VLAAVGYFLLFGPFVLFAVLIASGPPIEGTVVALNRSSELWSRVGGALFFFFHLKILIGIAWVSGLFWFAWMMSRNFPNTYKAFVLAATTLVVMYVVIQVLRYLELPIGSGDAP